MPIRIDNRGGSIGSAVNGGTAGSVLFVDADGLMGQENPGFTWDGTTLTAAGNIVTNELISHNGNLNTYTQYLTDEYRIVAGGETLGIFHEDGSQDYVKLGDGGDVDINLNDDVFVEGSSGNVGIGVTDPDSKLEVSGDIHLTTDADKLLFGTASDASIKYDGSDMVFTQEVGAGDFVFTGGKVGIGTATPNAPLTVYGYDTGSINIMNTTGNYSRVLLGTDASENGGFIELKNSNGTITRGTGTTVYLGGGANVDSYFNTGGNVGIGVTNPDAKLEVSGNIHLTTDADKLLFGTASDASIYFDATDLIINSENITANDEVHFTNFDAYTFDNNITTTADIVADGTITINSNIKIPGAMFWVEEIGTLTTGLQFSWGNGGTGNWGIYQPVDGKVIGMSINVDNDTATADTGQVDIAVNGTAAGGEYHVHNPGAANSGSSVTFGTPLSFSAGDRLTATTTVTPVDGTTADVIIAFWVVYD